MKFIALADYQADSVRVDGILPAHTDYVRSLRTQGKLASAGPYLDELGKKAGHYFIYEADSVVEAITLFRNDPFLVEGVFSGCEIKEWRMLGFNPQLLVELDRCVEIGWRRRRTYFINYARYTDDAGLLAMARPRHREYAKALRLQAKMAMSGPLSDDTGAMFVYRANSRKEALNLVKEDPYASEGVFAAFRLLEWHVEIFDIDAFFYRLDS